MTNNKRVAQKPKPYGRDKKHNKKDKTQKKEIVKIVDEKNVFDKTYDKLKKEGIYLLELKIALLRKDKRIYAVIIKKWENEISYISHNDCIEATKKIQESIKSEGFEENDYTITVSSAGFRWEFDDKYEIFINMPIKIRYSKENGEIKTVKAILKEAKEDYILIEDEKSEEIKILKKDIIKTRLNN